jgi:hypothetical protein
VEQHHLRHVYIGWSHDFSCTTKTENWNRVSTRSVGEHFDSTEVERLSFRLIWLLPHN